MGLLDGAKVTLDCPSCGHKFQETIGRLQNDPTLRCPSCNQAIQIEAQGLRDGIKGVDESMADLARTIKDLNKR